MIRILVMSFVLMFAGCADKFLGARIAVTSGRAALSMAQIGVSSADKGVQANCNSKVCLKLDPTQGAKYKECMTKEHQEDPTFKECYAKFAAFKAKWPQGVKTAEAALNTADASITLAEQVKGEIPPDVITVVKATACFAAQSLEFLPEKYKKYVQMYLDMMKAFGCSQQPAPTAPAPAAPVARETPTEQPRPKPSPAPAVPVIPARK